MVAKEYVGEGVFDMRRFFLLLLVMRSIERFERDTAEALIDQALAPCSS